MSDLRPTPGSLGPRPAYGVPAPASAPASELFRLEATRAGARVVQLRAVSAPDGYAVECQVEAVDGRATEPRRAERHSFATQAEAKAFVDEAAAALQYLGCYVRAGV